MKYALIILAYCACSYAQESTDSTLKTTRTPVSYDMELKQKCLDSLKAECAKTTGRQRDICTREIESFERDILRQMKSNKSSRNAGTDLVSASNYAFLSIICSAVGSILIASDNINAGGILAVASIPFGAMAWKKIGDAGERLDRAASAQ